MADFEAFKMNYGSEVVLSAKGPIPKFACARAHARAYSPLVALWRAGTIRHDHTPSTSYHYTESRVCIASLHRQRSRDE
jgi:hypothetical protein